MGYYTDYDLSYTLPEDTEGEDRQWLEMQLEEKLTDDKWCGYRLMHFVSGGYDACKWYSHEKDMRELSAYYFTVLFKLEGRGEEQGDHWVKYFLGGKMQECRAKITFDDFDESKLK